MSKTAKENSIGPHSFSWKLAAVSLFWFVVIYLLTSITEWGSDDTSKLWVYGTNETVRISSMSDILLSIGRFYMGGGGRLVAYFIAYVFMLFPKAVFDVLNAAVFVALGYLLYSFAIVGTWKAQEQKDPVLLNLIYLSLYFLIPCLWWVELWESGSIHYMWVCSISLSFGYFYYKKYARIQSGGGDPESRGRKADPYLCLWHDCSLYAGERGGGAADRTAGLLYLEIQERTAS